MKTYLLKTDPATENSPNSQDDLHLAFDVGHSSIGWAVLENTDGKLPAILGTGVVTFPSDDCLASQRRAFRRQRRHIRATRQRISRIQKLLAHLGVIAPERLAEKHRAAGGHSAPWLLAARVLRGGPLLNWEELWDVIRWYAHNRGYDGNKAWSAHEAEAEKEDTEKVERARNLLTDFQVKHGREGSMAEVFCDLSGLDPLGTKISCNLPGDKRPKALNAAFPREQVEREVRTVLERHVGVLPRLDQSFIKALMEDWTVILCEGIRLPRRYGQILAGGRRSPGGLLFGQLIPRFENRIIATCPVTFERVYQEAEEQALKPELAQHLREAIQRMEKKHGSPLKDEFLPEAWSHVATLAAKVPAKNSPEFLRFRWAMQVANVLVQDGSMPRSLNAEERQQLDVRMNEKGYLTAGEFRKAVREISGVKTDNIEQMLSHPDAEQALVVDPARKAVSSGHWAVLFPCLPGPLQARCLRRLRQGKSVSLGELLRETQDLFDESIDAYLTAQSTKKGKREKVLTRNDILASPTRAAVVSGRAPYARPVLKETADFVFSTDRHPASETGPLYRSESIRRAQLQRAIDEQTNNHLVRHRLLLLERLHRDILKEFAGSDPGRVSRITIEVNRDLREMSGKTAQDVAKDMSLKLRNFNDVSKKLENDLAGTNIRITAGLIRKARIADDLKWQCPYTGKSFDAITLSRGAVDKDHIIPRADRPSDSLESLVVTFDAINRWKGKRSAVQFIQEEGGKTCPFDKTLTLRTPDAFSEFVDSLEPRRDPRKDPFYKRARRPMDDALRRWKRKQLLGQREFVSKEFLPGDLTQTSQLVRLGAQMLERAYMDRDDKPVITSLPGSVTGTVRKAWNLLGCLATANPLVLNPDDRDETGHPRLHTKTEIRGITHLHHALDACVLALISRFFPNNGGVWELLIKRRLSKDEQSELRKRVGDRVEFSQDGQIVLRELPQTMRANIRHRLAERRVVQHIPKEMSGLRVEQNAWRVVSIQNGEALLRQRIRQPDGTRPVKEAREKTFKLLGLHPGGGVGKLQRNNSALIIPDNFGLALDPQPIVIPFHKVPVRLREIRERNGGRTPRILRNGMIVQIRGESIEAKGLSGLWRIYSLKGSGKADLVRPDVVGRPSTGPVWREVNLARLSADQIQIIDYSLCGVGM